MVNNDLEFIYEQLKNKCDLLLTNTFALDNGYTIDVPVLCGESVLGKFELYVDDDFQDGSYEFVFSVTFPAPKKRSWFFSADTGTHWHPQTKEQALMDVIAFMEGTHKYCL